MRYYNEKTDFSLKNINMTKDENGSFCLSFKIFPIDEQKSNQLTKILTDRELEILKLVVEGKNNSEIAKELVVSVNTVKAHLTNIFQKMKVKDRVQAVVKAIQENIIWCDYKSEDMW